MPMIVYDILWLYMILDGLIGKDETKNNKSCT